ncbi:MAG: choice-of-anchor E domain-containing protein [Tepidisphaeraceae bacterium]
MKLSLLAASVLYAGIADRAQADSEFFTASVTTPSTPLDWSSSEGLGFTQFNPSLGTLNSAEIALVITNAQGTITVPTPSYAEGHYGVFELFDSIAVEYDPNSVAMNYFSGLAELDSASEATTTVPSQQVTPTFDVSSGDLASFTGEGTVSLSATTNSNASWVDSTMELTYYGSAEVSESLGGAIEYDYTPAAVPEPGSMSLLAVSGAGLLARRRRSKIVSAEAGI